MKTFRASLAMGLTLVSLCGGTPTSAKAATPAGSTTEASAAEGQPSQGTAGAGISQPPQAPAASTSSPQSLSNETTLTTWAHPEIEGPIFSHPGPTASRIAKVHLYTEDGFPEVYVLLDSYVDAEGREWVRLRIPGRPNGRIGWTYRELLGGFHHTRWQIVVNRSTHRMSVYFAGRLRRVFPVGVGKPSTPTPPGHFWIRERFKLTNPSNPYWPYALGTSDYSTLSEWPGGGVVGIHGAFGEPQKIPGDPSHGCIRMLDPDIAWLGPHVTLGTPVIVTG